MALLHVRHHQLPLGYFSVAAVRRLVIFLYANNNHLLSIHRPLDLAQQDNTTIRTVAVAPAVISSRSSSRRCCTRCCRSSSNPITMPWCGPYAHRSHEHTHARTSERTNKTRYRGLQMSISRHANATTCANATGNRGGRMRGAAWLHGGTAGGMHCARRGQVTHQCQRPDIADTKRRFEHVGRGALGRLGDWSVARS